ncbi:hypothetical protein GCM10023063_18620 [Arthrobacter methylotrophus]|uniref:Uncharacterized protein n=1 Tax=Arthrobacter methylotrophus TaxID=121291 RepID=A0ABV5UP13_9MICC
MSTVAEKKATGEAQKRKVSPAQERVIVRAARLRLSTDKKQGLESPAWVRKIAKRPL